MINIKMISMFIIEMVDLRTHFAFVTYHHHPFSISITAPRCQLTWSLQAMVDMETLRVEKLDIEELKLKLIPKI